MNVLHLLSSISYRFSHLYPGSLVIIHFSLSLSSKYSLYSLSNPALLGEVIQLLSLSAPQFSQLPNGGSETYLSLALWWLKDTIWKHALQPVKVNTACILSGKLRWANRERQNLGMWTLWLLIMTLPRTEGKNIDTGSLGWIPDSTSNELCGLGQDT